MNKYKLNYLHEISSLEVSYPIGRDISSAIESAEKIANVFNTLEMFKNKTLNIWCRGSSGSVLAALFISKIPNKCFLQYVRKEFEQTHCTNEFSLDSSALNIVIDDLISSGFTLNCIVQHIPNKEVDLLIICGYMNDSRLDSLEFIPKSLICCGNFSRLTD